MRLRSSVSSLHSDPAAAAGRILVGATLIIGFAALTLGSLPASADEADEVTQTAARDSDSDQLSERQRRREERRQSREAESSDADTGQANAAENSESQFVVAVEPEMECRRVPVTGSRVPREVCTPVGQAAQDEQNAQDFLRRTRELSTVVPEDDRNNPFMQPSAF
ncbi:MAG TPA: hypothetical protein VMR74_08445 [Gammaproteobacteria bacterium]|nr:hypothetical protein [Gammaproteobacteria bacterium]